MRSRQKVTERDARRSDRKLDPNKPHTFPRRVLLAVTGLSPQVVTETIYALVRGNPAFHPTQVVLVTTSEGAKRARLMLLSEDPGWFHRLRRDWSLPEIRFDESSIVSLRVSDIRTRQENETLADALTDRIRKITADPECALHVSIAGGRKTMGFYAGYALSLFGRPQDRLSHVLVSEPYESNAEFFYPTPYSRVIHTQDKGPIDTKEAKVGLADIPFVRLREEFDDRLLTGTVTFSKAVEAAQMALAPLSLNFDWEEKCIRAAGTTVALQPTLLSFLSWLARRAKAGKPAVMCPTKKGDRAYITEYATEYLAELANVRSDDTLTSIRLRKGMSKVFFEEMKSKLSRELKRALGPDGAKRYGVVDDGGRPKRYSVGVPRDMIRWIGESAPDDRRKLAETAQPPKREL